METCYMAERKSCYSQYSEPLSVFRVAIANNNIHITSFSVDGRRVIVFHPMFQNYTTKIQLRTGVLLGKTICVIKMLFYIFTIFKGHT